MKDSRFNKYLHSVKDWFRTIGSDCSSCSYMRNVLPQAIGQGPKKFGHTYKAKIDYSAIVIKQLCETILNIQKSGPSNKVT